MNSSLSGVPIGARRRLAATVALFAVLFVAVGAVAATGRGTVAAPVFSVIALVIGAVLALIGWGIARSVKLDLADQRLDTAIDDAIAAGGGHAAMCGCGHEHDPDELHITDACEHDGTGAACEHNCDTCVLAALRPSPSPSSSHRITG